MTALRAGSATDVGLVRSLNEDDYLIAEPLFAVADGMGGHAAGEVASATAVTALSEAFTEYTPAGLAAATRSANQAVWERAQGSDDLRGMGTTLVALARIREGGADRLAVANVGDSRVYLLHDSQLSQITSDHSLVGELVAEGSITEAEAEVHPRRHVLTRALGVDPDVDVDLVTMDLRPGDRYLLCSDGLSRELTDDQVASVLRRLGDPEEAAHELVGRARAHGGNDNITVVLVDVVEDGAAPRGPELGAATGRDGPGTVTGEPGAGLAGTDIADAGLAGAGIAAQSTPPSPDGPAPSVSAPEDPTPERPADASAPPNEAPTTALRIESGPAPPKLGWARRKARQRAAPSARLITPRVLGFFALFLLLVGIAIGGIAYYARETYYVGVQGPRLVIFQGRPGGVLWFEPTVADRPDVSTAGVLPVHLPELRAGKVEPSLSAARQYVDNLHQEYLAAHPAKTRHSNTRPSNTRPSNTGPTTVTSTIPTGSGGTTSGTVSPGTSAPPPTTPASP